MTDNERIEAAEEYLAEIKEKRRRWELAEERVSEWAEITGVDYSTVSVSCSNAPDSIPNAVIHHEELIDKARMRMLEFYDAVFEMQEIASMMDNAALGLIIVMRYSNGKKWTDVADALGYTETHAISLRRKALVEFHKAMMEYDGKVNS